MSGKPSGEHRHLCPLCLVTVPCADPLPHRVGLPPRGGAFRLSTEPELTQRFRVCEKCRLREGGKGMSDLTFLARRLERGMPPESAVDVLAERLIARTKGIAGPFRDSLYGRSKEEARAFALRDYEEMRERTRVPLPLPDGPWICECGRTNEKGAESCAACSEPGLPSERDAALTVLRRYPKAGFRSQRAVIQAAYRLRLELEVKKKGRKPAR